MVSAYAALSRGQTRQALIDGSAALDITTAQLTISLLERGGMSTDEAEAKVEGLATKQLVLRLLSAKLGAPLTESTQWSAWDTKVRQLRNAAVHTGTAPPLRATADALRSIANLIDLLQKLCAGVA